MIDITQSIKACAAFYGKDADMIGIKRDDLSHMAIGSVLTKDLAIIRSSVE